MPVMKVCGVDCEVDYVADGFARGPDGTCAYCHGDPCAEYSEKDAAIYQYMREPDGRYRKGASTCPNCSGRAT